MEGVRRWGDVWLPRAVALAAVALVSVLALVLPLRLHQPDPYAYRASIVALRDGRVTLTEGQFLSLAARLAHEDDGWDSRIGIMQWTRTPEGRFVSEKNPGYPFLVYPFAVAGVVRLAPLVALLLGCFGLWLAGRRWLGEWGGALAVVLFCSSGTFVTMVSETYMPTATEASLLAGGGGLVLWALLDGRGGRAAVAGGAAGFLLISAAVLVRYTAAVVLAVLFVAALVWVLRRLCPVRARWLGLWGAAAVLGPALGLLYDRLVFGSVFATGYSRGVTFSAYAVARNLRSLPVALLAGIPVCVLAAAAVAWLAIAAVRRVKGAPMGRDLAVAAVLVAWWIAAWLTYAAYDWTTFPLQALEFPLTSRFYLPALGALALLGALLLVRLRPPVAVLVAAGLLAFGVAAGLFAVSGDWLYGHGRREPLGFEMPPGALPGLPNGLPSAAPGASGAPSVVPPESG